MIRMDKTKASQIFQKLKKEYPKVRVALHYKNPLELLIATILSAQCTDKQVNEVTPILFKKYKIRVILKPNIHQKFAIMDQRVIWYGSINFLSYGNAEESVMRIDSAHIANALLESISKKL